MRVKKEYFWLNIGAKYGITGDDLIIKDVTDEDDEYLSDCGNFPDKLSKLNGVYSK